MVDAVVVPTYNGVLIEPVPVQEVYSDLVHLNRTGSFGNAIFRTLRMNARGKEWSSTLNMPNSFAALHANITEDGTRGFERSNQEFAVGILNECWQAYSLVRDGMGPGGNADPEQWSGQALLPCAPSLTCTPRSTYAQTRAVLIAATTTVAETSADTAVVSAATTNASTSQPPFRANHTCSGEPYNVFLVAFLCLSDIS